MRHSFYLRLASAAAILGVLLCVLGVGLIVSRQKTEQGALDRGLATTAGEKAALVDTELERVRALALLTARIPPFSEFYADAGSQAAAIAAVAGPGREINEALEYLSTLYPTRIVAAGYVDVDGAENARVVGAKDTAPEDLLKNVSNWPGFAQGVATPEGQAEISAPFMSPRAGVQVVAATTPVVVDGRTRAFVELELATSALSGVLSSDLTGKTGVQIVDSSGNVISGTKVSFPALPHAPRAGLASHGGWRYAVRAVPTASLNTQWYVVAAGRTHSAFALAEGPTQASVLALGLFMFAVAGLALRRAQRAAADSLKAEQVAREEAERRSRTDALTGLFNRRHAVEHLAHEVARSDREGTGVGLLMIDIDRFKRVNDSQGHAGGDAVIVEVARRLQVGVREWDMVARIGGEEFFVVVPSVTTEDDVAELGNRLREAVADRPIRLPRGSEMAVTVSIGAVLVHRHEGSPEYAIDRADRALYAAKRRGRNRLCRFSQLDQLDLRAEQPEALLVAEAVALTNDLRRGAPAGRSRLVADLSAATSERLGLSEEGILLATLGGWLRDVGKIAIPDAILNKPGPLTQAEWELVRAHPLVGEELLLKFPELTSACPIVRHHHERVDGTGYPDKLAGDAIPLAARIVAVADSYSAMISDRPHAAKMTHAQAIAELRRCSGTQFDATVVDAFVAATSSKQSSVSGGQRRAGSGAPA